MSRTDQSTSLVGMLLIFTVFILLGLLPDFLEGDEEEETAIEDSHTVITDDYIMRGRINTIKICLDDSMVVRKGRHYKPGSLFEPLVLEIITNYWEKQSQKPVLDGDLREEW